MNHSLKQDCIVPNFNYALSNVFQTSEKWKDYHGPVLLHWIYFNTRATIWKLFVEVFDMKLLYIPNLVSLGHMVKDKKTFPF